MRHIKRAVIIIAVALVALGMAAAADQEIEIVNDTGFTIWYLYISPVTSEDWEEDVLGDDILDTGSSVTVTLEGYDTSVFDIMMEDDEGDTYYKWDYDVSEDPSVVFTLDDIYVAEEDLVTGFTITNTTGEQIKNLYVSPDYAEDWEEDLLADMGVLEHGETFEVSLEGYGYHTVFDLQMVDTNGNTYTRFGVDLWEDDDLYFSQGDID